MCGFILIIYVFITIQKNSGLVMGRRWRAGLGLGRAGPASPARPINVLYDEPRPGMAPQMFRGCAAARPGPSNFQGMDITFSKNHSPARPGPSHGSEAHETRALYGLARQLRGPARGFDGPAHGPSHMLSRTKRCMCMR